MYQLYLMNIYSADRRSNEGGNGIGRGGAGEGGGLHIIISVIIIVDPCCCIILAHTIHWRCVTGI